MKFPRKAMFITLAALIAASGSYAVGRLGIQPSHILSTTAQAVTESRCEAGAFVRHSQKADTVSADFDNSDSVPQTGASTGVASEAKAIGPNLFTNANVEKGTATGATNWSTNIYGQNNAKFSLTGGRGGGRGLRTEISEYTNGDSDWFVQPVTVQAGGYYRYQDYYRSNVSSRAVLMLKDDAGNEQYINLPAAGPASDWTLYQTTFFVPSNVHSATVYHPLAAKGTLETDDFNLQQVQSVGFSHPIVTVTFDDGWKSIHDNALPLMERYDIASTQYIITGYIGQAKDYMTASDVYDFRDAGNEIASHTVDHKDLTKLNATELEEELGRSQQDITKCFGGTTDFAAPYGTYSQTTTDAIKQRYQTARSTDAGFNTADNLNPYGLLVQNISASTSAEQIRSWVDTARQNNAWLILVYHEVDDSGSNYARKTSDFEHDLQIIKASGLSVKTMHQAYQDVTAQAAASKK